MSDLAAPLLYVMHDEAEAFWAFAALMDRCEANFHTDCTCVRCGDCWQHDLDSIPTCCACPPYCSAIRPCCAGLWKDHGVKHQLQRSKPCCALCSSAAAWPPALFNLFDHFPMRGLRSCSGMHRQLGALREMVAALDPGLHALLAARDATNYFFCYRWCADWLVGLPCLSACCRTMQCCSSVQRKC